MAYHAVMSMINQQARGIIKTAGRQAVMRFQDYKDWGVQDPNHGENILVEWALSKLIDFINAEAWEQADDLILNFPRTLAKESYDLYEQLVRMRHEFEKTPGREIIEKDFSMIEAYNPPDLEGHVWRGSRSLLKDHDEIERLTGKDTA